MSVSAVTYPGRPSRGRVRWLPAAAGLATVAALAAWMVVSQFSTPARDSGVAAASFEQATGIRVTRIALTGGGGIVDVRYRVVDPSAAAVLHAKGNRLKLVDEDSGRTLSTTFHFHVHTSVFKAGVGYYELLVNTAGLLEPGETVSVVVGGAVLKGVRVL